VSQWEEVVINKSLGNEMKIHHIFLLIAAIFLVYINSLIEKVDITSSAGIGYVVGTFIGGFAFAGILVLISAGVYWLFKRKRMPNLNTTLWVLLVVLLVLGILGKPQLVGLISQSDKSSMSKAVENITQIASTLDDERFDSEGYLIESKTSISSETEASGTWGEIESFFRAYLEKERKLSNAYVRALDDLAWESLLDYERLRNDRDLAQSKLIVAQAKRAVALYSQRELNHINSLQPGVEQINFGSEKEREEFLNGFNKTYPQTKSNSIQVIQYEQDIVDITGQLISFLDQTQGSWQEEDGNLYFDSDENIAKYNTIFGDLELVIERQNSLILKMRLDQAKRTEKARNFFNNQ
jgi:hypothetical protein